MKAEGVRMLVRERVVRFEMGGGGGGVGGTEVEFVEFVEAMELVEVVELALGSVALAVESALGSVGVVGVVGAMLVSVELVSVELVSVELVEVTIVPVRRSSPSPPHPTAPMNRTTISSLHHTSSLSQYIGRVSPPACTTLNSRTPRNLPGSLIRFRNPGPGSRTSNTSNTLQSITCNQRSKFLAKYLSGAGPGGISAKTCLDGPLPSSKSIHVCSQCQLRSYPAARRSSLHFQ